MNLNPMRWFRGEKAVDAMTHQGMSNRFFGWAADALLGQRIAGDSYDYRSKVGDGIDASVVMAPVNWIQRALPEAPLVVERAKGNEEWEPTEHQLTALLDKPNPGYSGIQLLQATFYSLLIAGNAYWIIVRNAMGPVELWYVPHWMISPAWPQDGSAFISHYEYKPGGRDVRLEIEDVIHFREGIDPRNLRLGLSPIYPALREIWTDMEATTFTASLLRNNGVPGLIISPDNDMMVTSEDMQYTQEVVNQQFTGEKRGNSMVMSGKVTVERVGFNPNEMNLSGLRDLPEERVCALIGLPAAIVGFTSGLETAKVGATMGEMRKLAWNNAIIPRQVSVASEIARKLLPLFRGSGTGKLRVRFDTSKVAALQEDETAKFARATQGVQSQWLTVADAKRMIGMEPEAADEVYLRSFTTVEVPVGTSRELPQETEPQPVEDQEKVFHRKETPAENRIADSTPRARPNTAQLRFIRTLTAQATGLENAAAQNLERFFRDEIGKRVSAVVEEALRDSSLKQPTPEDRLIVERILADAGIRDTQPIYKRIIEQVYLEVAKSSADALATMGVGTGLVDAVGRSVIAAGGRRAGLVDLESQTRDALFKTLTEARASGLGAEDTARIIREIAPAGPWSTPQIRARVIARTETKFAQNVSVIESAKEQGVIQYMVFDGRLPTSDELCISLDGAIVTAEQAQRLMEDEHPNGSRSFSPYFG